MVRRSIIVARSPMPDLMRCGVVNSGPAHSLNCTPAESNLIPSVARKRVKAAATRISQCGEPVVGPLKSASEHCHLQWFRYGLARVLARSISPRLEPRVTGAGLDAFVAEPMTITNDWRREGDPCSEAARLRGRTGCFCRQVLPLRGLRN